jgi:hypothetical protein
MRTRFTIAAVSATVIMLAVFINGKRFRGDRSLEAFSAAIETELKKRPAK